MSMIGDIKTIGRKNKNYEQGIGFNICQHVKYYYISKDIMLVNNNNFTHEWKQLGDDGVLTPTGLKFKK